MQIFLGNKKCNRFYVGNMKVTRIYAGSRLVYNEHPFVYNYYYPTMDSNVSDNLLDESNKCIITSYGSAKFNSICNNLEKPLCQTSSNNFIGVLSCSYYNYNSINIQSSCTQIMDNAEHTQCEEISMFNDSTNLSEDIVDTSVVVTEVVTGSKELENAY